MLLQAEEEVKKQVAELTQKKMEQMTQVAQSICTNTQLEELDQKMNVIAEREEEKKKDLEAVQGELNQLETEAQRGIECSRNVVWITEVNLV